MPDTLGRGAPSLPEVIAALGFTPASTSDLAARQAVLTATTVKTGTYTAGANELIPVDATAGAITINLPSAPADKTRFVVKKIDTGTNPVTLVCQGSDRFNTATGPTTRTLTLVNEAAQVQYNAALSVWYVISSDLPLAQIDSRYIQLGGTFDAGGEPLAAGEATMQRRNVSTAAASTSNGVLRLTYFTARKTEVVTAVRTLSGSTAGVGATLARIGVYEENPSTLDLTLVASTANDTTLWSAASTSYTKSLTAAFTKTQGKRYAVGNLVVGSTTAPTLYGHSTLLGAEALIAPRLAASATAAQTDLPSSLAASALSSSGAQHYAVLLP